MLLDGGHTATAATGTTVTLIAALPLAPSLVAVIVVEPGATPLTNPLLETVATAGLSFSHLTARPVTKVPAASLSVTVSCIVCPTGRAPDDGDTSTEATADDVGAVVSLARQLIAAYAAVIEAKTWFTPGQGRTTYLPGQVRKFLCGERYRVPTYSQGAIRAGSLVTRTLVRP